MKNLNKIVLGLLLVLVGVVVLLNSLGVMNINLFFDGWWTLFIIVPSIVGLINEKNKMGNIVGLLIGILLLLLSRDIITWGLLLRLFFPLILIIAGVGILFNETIKSGVSKKIDERKNGLENIVATFTSQKMKIEKKFDGCIIDAIFGSVKLDLTDALIVDETVIKANAIFGGVEICLPKDVQIKVKSTPIFGGVSNQYKEDKESSKIVYIESLALFGEVELK